MKKKITIKNVAIGLIILVIFGGIIQAGLKNKGASSGASAARGYTFASLVGKPAPTFTLTDRQGNTITNESLKGKNVLLFFNEGLACYPACWNQMTGFSKDTRFNGSNTVVLSVVTDSPASWQQATEKMSDLAAVNVAFDPGTSASQAFGATNVPSSMHPGQDGHSYVIIDKDGIVRYVFDDPSMAVNNDKLSAELSKLQ